MSVEFYLIEHVWFPVPVIGQLYAIIINDKTETKCISSDKERQCSCSENTLIFSIPLIFNHLDNM